MAKKAGALGLRRSPEARHALFKRRVKNPWVASEPREAPLSDAELRSMFPDACRCMEVRVK